MGQFVIGVSHKIQTEINGSSKADLVAADPVSIFFTVTSIITVNVSVFFTISRSLISLQKFKFLQNNNMKLWLVTCL
jgi:hypothetical protein